MELTLDIPFIRDLLTGGINGLQHERRACGTEVGKLARLFNGSGRVRVLDALVP
jgi:hypothetical protein